VGWQEMTIAYVFKRPSLPAVFARVFVRAMASICRWTRYCAQNCTARSMWRNHAHDHAHENASGNGPLGRARVDRKILNSYINWFRHLGPIVMCASLWLIKALWLLIAEQPKSCCYRPPPLSNACSNKYTTPSGLAATDH
jgi:hypothetical protein